MNSPWSRREFIQTTAAVTGGLAAGYANAVAAPSRVGTEPMPISALLVGGAPKPVAFPHFPSRLHAFVWRNWPLVPVARMAEVVGATPGQIVQLGEALGLGAPPHITRDQRRRSYITVIKRNWHLLPYEQLLKLLGWTAEEMAYTLREDDFLFIKLGSLKPHCEPLRWAASDELMRQREHEIARIVRQEFDPSLDQPGDPLFSFVSRLSATLPEESHGASGSQGPAVLLFLLCPLRRSLARHGGRSVSRWSSGPTGGGRR